MVRPNIRFMCRMSPDLIHSYRTARTTLIPNYLINLSFPSTKPLMNKSKIKTKRDYSEALELLTLLDVSEDDLLRALLSVFASVQPGPVRQSWLRSADYGHAPSTRDIWDTFVRDGFRCQLCGTHADLTIDHINRDNQDVSPENLRVLCRRHNRGTNSRPVANEDANLRIYRAIQHSRKTTGNLPSPAQIRTTTGIGDLSGSIYMVKFFEHFFGVSRPMRSYTSKKSKYS
jgi:hypothetical protein